MATDRAEVARRVLNELVRLLPPVGSEFPVEDRADWLRAMAATLALAHGFEGQIIIEVEQPSADELPKPV